MSSQQRVLELLEMLGGQAHAREIRELAIRLEPSSSLATIKGHVHVKLRRLHSWGLVEVTLDEHGRLLYTLGKVQIDA